ncbi:hypothetical protein QUB11_13130 [Microcoleus sp. B6-A1]|uniref:hypothetical protein n=1 Tax=Microcoleus sp. B6-A1 TaxID=2818684 RepID=UPI002FD072AB
MTIPAVMQGLIETEDGKVFELDSPKGAAWLESVGSFRYEPTGDGKPYTVRKEGKNGEYWYGCRKVAGKVRKKYIGKSSEVSVVKLEETAEALEIPPVPRTEKVAKRVAEVSQVAEVAEVAEVSQVAERVAEVSQVAERVAESRVTALELQVATLLKAVEALQEVLPGKFESGDSLELPKVHNEVVERLQNELSNLEAENKTLRNQLEESTLQIHGYQDAEITLRATVDKALANSGIWSTRLTKCQESLERQTREADKNRTFFVEEQAEKEKIKADYDALLKSSSHMKTKLEGEVRELQSKLKREEVDREEVEAKLAEREVELSDLRQKSVTASKDLPDAGDLLNQLMAKYEKKKVEGMKPKKPTASLADIEGILELLVREP